MMDRWLVTVWVIILLIGVTWWYLVIHLLAAIWRN
jgi:hypothetical protein